MSCNNNRFVSVDASLREYIEATILPMYDHFDSAHQRDHVEMVMEQSEALARHLDVNANMVYTIAAYHDTGLVEGRAIHHLASGRILRSDKRLPDWFSSEQIEIMAEAVEDHRASNDHEPRSIYGRIVAEADRFINPDLIIERTVEYGLDHYPELDKEGHFQRALSHLNEKYGEHGYLRLWFSDSPNAQRLEALRAIIRDKNKIRQKFESMWKKLT